MNTIKIENDFSYFISEDENLKQELYKRLRFRDKNYFHNRAYKMRKWDGFINFFEVEKGKFLTGLLPEVSAVLKHYNVEYEIQDKRISTKLLYEKIDDQFLNQWLPEKTINGDPMSPITLYDYQVDLINQVIKHKRGVVYAPTSAGKAQPLDSLVATPKGFKKMGEIKVGDEVLVPSGGKANVIGVFPQGKKNILKIDFSNGDSVECCEDHLWKVNALYDQWQGKILTAKEIEKRFKCPNGSNRFNISTPKKIDFEEKENFIDPYFMGLLLGDGSFRSKGSLNLSSNDKEILNHIKENLKNNLCLKHISRYDYRIAKKTGRYGLKINSYVNEIEKLKLEKLYSHEKFIPECYLINSEKNRMSLLQGLMDTDGYVDKNGRMSFTSTSEKLALGVKWLVQSLGGVAFLSHAIKKYTYKNIKKKEKKYYIVSFTLPQGLCPFRLKRKKNRYKEERIKNKNRTICNVTKIGEKECQCILVNHPEHLYITDNFIVTHNTNIMIGILKTIPKNTPTLVLQNRVSLAQQNYDEIVNWGFENVGSLWGKSVNPNIITVASVQSIGKIEKLLPKIKVLIVDEIHDMMSNLPKAVYKRLKSADIRVAVSATPFKFGGKDQVQKFQVRGFFGPVLKVKSTETGILTTSELQNRGILSESKCIFYPIREPQIPHDIYLDAVTRGIAENFEFHKIVKKLAENQNGRTLILVDRIAHGDTLHSMLPNSLWVRGQDTLDTRKEVIKKLQKTKGNIIAIATHHIFNTGVNVFVHNLINAAGGKADHQIIQRMGRGLRTAKDKEELNYYDFIFEINDYLKDHSMKRIKILQDEGHEIKITEVDF